MSKPLPDWVEYAAKADAMDLATLAFMEGYEIAYKRGARLVLERLERTRENDVRDEVAKADDRWESFQLGREAVRIEVLEGGES